MKRVSELSAVQLINTERITAIEKQKQSDNSILSKLVDILVKVRQFIQDKQYFDALMTIGIGVIAFKNLYSLINDADSKLKASDIQIKLLDNLGNVINETKLRDPLINSITQYLAFLKDDLEKKFNELKTNKSEVIYLDSEQESILEIGEDCIPDRFLYKLNTDIIIFKKDVIYNVVDVKSTEPWGFYLINEIGQKHLLHFDNRGAADKFRFFDPAIPSLRKEIYDWELFISFFNEQFLNENLKSFSKEILVIGQEGFNK